MTTKNELKKRVSHLETTRTRHRNAEAMTDSELCDIIGIDEPPDEQLKAIIEAKL